MKSLSGRSYSISGIQDYFEYIKKYETLTDKPPVLTYFN